MKYKVVKNGHAVLGKYDYKEEAEDSIKRDVKKMIEFQKIPLIPYEVLENEATTVLIYQALDDLHFEVYLIVEVITD